MIIFSRKISKSTLFSRPIFNNDIIEARKKLYHIDNVGDNNESWYNLITKSESNIKFFQ